MERQAQAPASNSPTPGDNPLNQMLERFLADTHEESVFSQASKVVLDEAKPLSQSYLWQLQSDYYAGEGIAAWNNSVPFLITNSTFIAESYGDLIIAFLRDYLPYLDTSAPVYILEISAGTGRFSYYLLRELERKRQYYAELDGVQLKYVMTEFAEKNIVFWEQHEKLRPFVESGLLDFAVYRPEEQDSLTLRVSGQTLGRDDFKNPLLPIANYLFDTVRHDLFRTHHQRLEEGLVELRRPADLPEPVQIAEVETVLSYRPMANEDYYEAPHWNRILAEYRNSDGQIIFPVGAFRCIDNLRRLCGDNMALFVSDKGYASAESMLLCKDHTFAAHGAFSYPVNFHALGLYFTHAQGEVFQTDGVNFNLKTACYLNLPQSGLDWENLMHLFGEKLDRNTPINTLMELDSMTLFYHPGQPHEISINMMLGVIRASYFDPQTFCHCAPHIAESFEHITWPQLQELRHAMQQTWQNYYYFPGECNLPVWMSQLYACMDEAELSLEFMLHTEAYFGAQPMLHCMIGQTCEHLGRYAEARERYQQALAMDPSLEMVKGRLDSLPR